MTSFISGTSLAMLGGKSYSNITRQCLPLLSLQRGLNTFEFDEMGYVCMCVCVWCMSSVGVGTCVCVF